MNSKEDSLKTFTKKKFSRKTRWTVLLADHLSRWLITIGGIGTILVVSTVCIFLVWVVVPLFLPPSLETTGEYPLPWSKPSHNILYLGMDEFRVLGWALFKDGNIVVFRLDNGELIQKLNPTQERTITASSFSVNEKNCVLGYDNGSVQIGKLGIATKFLEEEEVLDEFRDTPVGERKNYKNGVVVRIPSGQFRLHQFSPELKEPIQVAENQPIRLLSHSSQASGMMFCAMSDEGILTIDSLREQKNFLTGKISYHESKSLLPFTVPGSRSFPDDLKIGGLGDSVYVIWKDGHVMRFDTGNFKNPQLAEELDFVKEEGETLTCVDFLIGRKTLITGDSLGRVRAWFKIRPEEVETPDEMKLVMAHEMPSADIPVTSLGPSQRSRVISAGYQDGSIRFFHVTSNQMLIEIKTKSNTEITELFFSGKEDGLLAVASNNCWHWDVDLKHPEVTLESIFTPVWYEGYQQPAHVWQTSSATDAFEPKYGMVPLIFGTLKATLYSMLFALPLAILAAIYTSEFMHSKVKGVVKPTIEMMASLPSVVLGFLAALVFAPFIEKFVPQVLVSFITLPLAFLIGANLWQSLPYRWTLYLSKLRTFFIVLFLPIGIFAAIELGPYLQNWLFGGDIKAWLDHRAGIATPGWVFLLLPGCGFLAVLAMVSWINPWLRSQSSGWGRTKLAWMETIKFILGCLITLGMAFFIGSFLTDLGFDPRGSVFDTYEQRNAMIVGFVMAFAVIPIIYTIAEDALSSVPEHLRSASLACGATPWQTAVNIIIPTAMSGLFSAVMIGLGRAVGETMIVLMAAGNTPVLDWNIFNGFRTLSANIAVEIPEAVRNSTHYRTLFLAALFLFIITFLVNTLAEFVRLKFRKRAYEL